MMPNNNSLAATSLASVLEKMINQALKYDPATQQALFDFAGKNLAINVTQPALALRFAFTEKGIMVNAIQDIETITADHYDAIAKGTAKDFLSVANQDQSTLTDSGISVSGNMAFLSQVQAVAKNIDIDWEDAITQIIGPVAGHGVATVISAYANNVKNTLQFTQENMHSVLRDELQLVPAQEELDQFYDEVDDIKEQTERLDAKIQAYIHTLK